MKPIVFLREQLQEERDRIEWGIIKGIGPNWLTIEIEKEGVLRILNEIENEHCIVGITFRPK